ncbi:lipopolysaccharide biosynthesis protein [Agriterribacter sp.]|uniref:lipopolysaccharide biosynthesis protein n=1 Tax=Agriterribacter sp. TaxID=2821509 RepID=UPI002B54E18B|nr:lipopolysaccharide biosynthesis protein [Agriterribacter sp.]HRP58353.1 lipopolysaccharide biosynthesis protein [Agriterribacter sp.]
MSLARKALTGLSWTFAQQFGTQFISFGASVILARVLLPEEFGLIGILAIFMSVGNVLINAGLTTSLIRTENPDQHDYSTVFFINLIGSVVVYWTIFFAAPLIARFFRQPALIDIARVYTLAFIINAFSGVQLARLTKQLDFKTQLTVQLPSLIISSLLGVYLAYSGYGVWSLVWMYLCQASLSSLQLWFRTGWRPDFLFDKERFSRHFNFGYKLMLSGLIDAVYNNAYNIIIGRIYPAAQLGYYTRAMSIRQLPVQNLATALNKVTFPVFSSIQQDNERLKAAYKRIMQQVIFWTTPTLVILGIVAKPLFVLLFTDKWLPAVPYFQILCIPGILYPLQAYNLNILNVKGRSDLFLRLELVKRAFITVGILLAIPFGIYGLLYFQIISSLFGYFVNSWYSGKMIAYGVKDQLRDIMPIILLALVTGIFVWFIDAKILQLSGWNDLGRVGIGIIIYFIAYLGMGAVLKFSPIADFKKLVLKR